MTIFTRLFECLQFSYFVINDKLFNSDGLNGPNGPNALKNAEKTKALRLAAAPGPVVALAAPNGKVVRARKRRKKDAGPTFASGPLGRVGPRGHVTCVGLKRS